MSRILLLLACLLFTCSLNAAQKPNVVVFLVDDMGWMDCGVYGSQYYKTPNIDRFARRAMRFTDAYAQPLCSPTRCSLLTGKYSARHGITSATGHQPPQPPGHAFLPASAAANKPMITPESRNYMEPSEYTLAEALRDAGYRTAHIGKWHLGLTQPHWPEQQGFDWAFHCHPDPGPPGNYFSPYGVTPTGAPSAKARVGTITDGPKGEYIVDRLGDEAVTFIQANKDRPFFLNLWNYGVHGPWGHKIEYTQKYMGVKDPRGAQGNPIMASMLQSVDECFGRVLDTLDKLGIAENTIIVFNSDNGGNTHSNTGVGAKEERKAANAAKAAKAKKNANTEEPPGNDWQKWAGNRPPTINAPLRDGKGTLYEGGTRVPLMWAWAGHIKPGTASDAIVGHIDLYPTLLEMLGLPKPVRQTMDGVSYAAVLRGTGGVERRAFFNYFPHAGVGQAGGVWARAGDWKLIRWFGAASEAKFELYNLKDDLSETKNLAGAEPWRVKEMDALIDGFLADTGAAYPKPNPAYKPNPNAPAKGAAKGAKAALPLKGLVPKGCKATVIDGALHVEGEGRSPFLGTAQVKCPGPATVELRLRAPAGGAGKFQWRTEDQETFGEGQIVTYPLAAKSDWQDVRVDLPVKGKLVQLRIYLPAEKTPVDFASGRVIQKDSQKVVYEWSFK